MASLINNVRGFMLHKAIPNKFLHGLYVHWTSLYVLYLTVFLFADITRCRNKRCRNKRCRDARRYDTREK